MTNETIMEVLKKDRCAEAEAKKFLQMGTEVIEEADIEGFLKEWNMDMDEDEIITKEDIEAGKVENFNCVTLEGNKYYIMYVN